MITLALVMAMVAPGAPAQNSKHVVEARTVLAAEGAAPGSTLKAAAVAQIAAGYHINDHKPTMEYLIPTEWKIEATKEISVEKLVYPKGELKKFAFSDERLSVYEGALTVGVLLKIARTTKPGTYSLKADFKYQACNDHACLPPKSLPLVLRVNVVPRGAAVKRVNAEVFRDVRFE
jgi:hypothetical protein